MAHGSSSILQRCVERLKYFIKTSIKSMECDYTLVSLICLKVYQIIHVGWRVMTVLRLYNIPYIIRN